MPYKDPIKQKEFMHNYYRKWYAKNGRNRAIDYQEATLEWRRNHPKASNAHYLVKKALDKKTLIMPINCTACGRNARLNAHHNDYNKPLIVDWLCYSCHKLKHLDANS